MKRLDELSDDALTALVRKATSELPDAPPWLVETAVAMWRAPADPTPSLARRIAAQLSFDSWAQVPMPAHRSAFPAVRQLLFNAGGCDIDLRLGGSYIAGQVLGPEGGGGITLLRAGQVLAEAEFDDYGEFRFGDLTAGAYGLVLRFGEEVIELPDIELGDDQRS